MLGFIKKLLRGSAVNYRELMDNGAIIIDVRSAGEYRAGHIAGSRNYPLDSIRTKIKDLKKLNKPVITVCRSGARSGMAKNILKSAGIDVYNGGPWNLLERKIA